MGIMMTTAASARWTTTSTALSLPTGGQSVPAEKRSFPRIKTSLPRLVVRAATISSRRAVDLGQQVAGDPATSPDDRERATEAGRKGGQS